MSQTMELISNYNRIRDRLRYPPNAVPDRGINLHPNRIPLTGLSSKEVLEVLEPSSPIHCRVTVQTVYEPSNGPFVPRKVSVSAIERVVAKHFKVTIAALRGRCKARWICDPRQVIFYLSCLHTGLSLPRIARNYNRDHSTVLHAKRKIADLILVDPQMAETIRIIQSMLFGVHDNSHQASVPGVDQRDVHQQAGEGEKPLPVSGIQGLDNSGGVDAEHAETPAIQGQSGH